MSIKFFIVTPSFNQGEFIEQTIQSVLSQNVNLEYWVIDGGSKDQTLTILKKYKQLYSNFHYISEKDNGQSQAINKGIARFNGHIFAYINSDDFYLPNTFKIIEEYYLKFPNIDWFYGQSLIINKNGTLIRSFFSKVKNLLGKNYSYFKLLLCNIISQPAVFLKQNVIKTHPFFQESEHLVMDYEYWLQIGKNFQALPINKPLACYRLYNNSKSSSNFKTQYFRELILAFQYSKTHYNSFTSLLIFFLHGIFFLSIITWLKLTNSNP